MAAPAHSPGGHDDPAFVDQRAFDATGVSGLYTLSNGNRTLLRQGGPDGWQAGCVRSAEVFSSGTLAVTFHIDVVTPGHNLMVGFLQADAPITVEHPGNGFLSEGAALYSSNGRRYQANSSSEYPGCPVNWSVNSTVTMCINFTSGDMSFIVAGADRGCFAKHVKGPLRFAVSMNNVGGQVSITEVRYEPEQMSADELALQPPPGLADFQSPNGVWERSNAIVRAARDVRILTHGPPGAGKSRLINTWLTALTPGCDLPLEVVPSQRGPEHVTTQIRSYPLLRQVVTPKVTDSWGWTDKNYANGTLNFLMSGHLGVGFRHDGALSAQDPLFKRAPAAGDEIDAVVEVLSAKEVLEQPDAVRPRLLEFSRELFRTHGVNVVYVLTHIDQLPNCEKLALEPERAYEFPAVRKAVLAVSRWTGVSPNRVLPCKLYHGEASISRATEALPLFALAQSIREAERRQEERGQ